MRSKVRSIRKIDASCVVTQPFSISLTLGQIETLESAAFEHAGLPLRDLVEGILGILGDRPALLETVIVAGIEGADQP